MSFGDPVNEGKSSLEEESNSSMKIESARTTKLWRRMSSTSSFCLIVLTTKPTVPIVTMVSWKLWAKLPPIMQ